MNERIKELAEQAGFHISNSFDGIGWVWCSDGYPIDEQLIHFAELIRQDERNKCAQDYLQDCADAVEAARVEEREACAKIIDPYDSTTEWAKGLADAIRQRKDEK